MKSSAKKIELASVDDLFSTEEGRQDAKLEKIPRERKPSHRQSRRRSICWWTFRQNCRLEKVLAMLDGLKFLI